MPLFKIEGQKVLHVVQTEFGKERELQNLIDKNLEDILGVRLVESWFKIPNGEIDALCIDERNAPVVIEYKWKQDAGAIIQGLFYLNWVRENRRPFELLVKEKLGKAIDIDWNSPSRVIIIAKDFTPKDLAAIKYITPTVELKKYSYYGDLLNIEDLTPTKSRVGKVAEPSGEEGEEGEEYTIDKILKKASPGLREVFLNLRKRILELGDDVWEYVGSYYCDYRKSSTFASPNVQTKLNRLLVYIKMGDEEIDDPKHLTIKKDFNYGKLNTRFELKSLDQIDYAMHLIKQAYKYVP
jgi:predicted transport protein